MRRALAASAAASAQHEFETLGRVLKQELRIRADTEQKWAQRRALERKRRQNHGASALYVCVCVCLVVWCCAARCCEDGLQVRDGMEWDGMACDVM